MLYLNRLDLFWYLGFLKDVYLDHDLLNHLEGVLNLNNLVISMVNYDDLDMLNLYLA
jgi:hypothetical protein